MYVYIGPIVAGQCLFDYFARARLSRRVSNLELFSKCRPPTPPRDHSRLINVCNAFVCSRVCLLWCINSSMKVSLCAIWGDTNWRQLSNSCFPLTPLRNSLQKVSNAIVAIMGIVKRVKRFHQCRLQTAKARVWSSNLHRVLHKVCFGIWEFRQKVEIDLAIFTSKFLQLSYNGFIKWAFLKFVYSGFTQI